MDCTVKFIRAVGIDAHTEEYVEYTSLRQAIMDASAYHAKQSVKVNRASKLFTVAVLLWPEGNNEVEAISWTNGKTISMVFAEGG